MAWLTASLAAARTAAERLMLDTWQITIPQDGATPDPITGQTPRTTLYSGPGRLTTYQPFERSAQAAGAEVTLQRYSLHLPISAPTPPKDAVAECIDAVDEPALAGLKYRVLAPHRKSLATAQRVPVEERL